MEQREQRDDIGDVTQRLQDVLLRDDVVSFNISAIPYVLYLILNIDDPRLSSVDRPLSKYRPYGVVEEENSTHKVVVVRRRDYDVDVHNDFAPMISWQDFRAMWQGERGTDMDDREQGLEPFKLMLCPSDLMVLSHSDEDAPLFSKAFMDDLTHEELFQELCRCINSPGSPNYEYFYDFNLNNIAFKFMTYCSDKQTYVGVGPLFFDRKMVQSPPFKVTCNRGYYRGNSREEDVIFHWCVVATLNSTRERIRQDLALREVPLYAAFLAFVEAKIAKHHDTLKSLLVFLCSVGAIQDPNGRVLNAKDVIGMAAPITFTGDVPELTGIV